MKRNHLKKAILLGLIAASIHAPVWAEPEPETIGGLWGSNINKTQESGKDLTIKADGVGIGFAGTVTVTPDEKGTGGDLMVTAGGNGILAGYQEKATVNISANNVTIDSDDNGIFTTWGDNIWDENGITEDAKLAAKENNTPIYVNKNATHWGVVNIGTQDNAVDKLNIYADGQGIDNKKGEINVYGSSISISSTGSGGINDNQAGIASGYIYTSDDGITVKTNGDTAVHGNTISITAEGGDGIATLVKDSNTVIQATNSITITSNNLNNTIDSSGNIIVDGLKTIENAGINNMAGTTEVTAENDISITSSQYGILAQSGTVDVTSNAGSNIIRAFTAITPEGDSAATEETAEEEAEKRDAVAVYAKDKAVINLTAGTNGVNYIATEIAEKDSTADERTIWAQRGGKINIKGQTFIIASNANTYTEDAIEGEEQVKGNAIGIAITAGSEEIPENGINSIEDESRSHVTVEYNANGPLNSFISGDIVSGYGGLIDIRKTDDSGLDLMGNALAANGGKLNLDLGNGGTWLGRADDYGDAGVITDDKHTTFFDPAFSNEIIQGGQVNLTMGEGSRWNINGQSWITSIKTTTGDLTTGTPVIDLVNANTDRTTTAHALTVYELTGNAIFNMSLDGNREVSDMLYIKKADGEYVINVVDAVSVADMYQNDFKGLRFATIGDGSDVSFRAVTYDQGINNIEYLIDTDSYEENQENDAYNSTEDDGGMNTEKPGSARVDEFFDSTGTPDDPLGTDTDTDANGDTIMTLDAETEGTPGTDGQVHGTTNFKLVGIKNSDLSDGGKTVVNMSRVNYSNAVYMDRLNKRLGEARYINEEEDQGMWVRVRHDRIGKDDAFRLMNTMYELGYDKKQESDSGERRFGAAIDYMDGSSSYTSVSGSGDISRKGIWLYDTWLGHKGHYRDFVAKWGHLSNDFTLYRGGDKITGDYCNNVYSLSAEYGRKKDLGHDWYFEPQAQLQYARVTGADYTTSQGTRVDLDAIDSLIARAGFRLGRDLDERSTVYFKADLLHEFLGDQNIYAADGTGTMNVTYDNEGTWFDVGLGFSKALSETSYVYLDVETSLGNDFEDTYQINAGLQWSFS